MRKSMDTVVIVLIVRSLPVLAIAEPNAPPMKWVTLKSDPVRLIACGERSTTPASVAIWLASIC